MADGITIPVKTQLDPKAFRQLEREARLARQEQMHGLKIQQQEVKLEQQKLRLMEQQERAARKANQQQSQSQKRPFSEQVGNAVGRNFLAANVLQDTLGFLKDFTAQSFQAANAAERLGAATDTLSRRFGSTGDDIVASIQKSSNYTINQMNAMQAANQAMLLGVAKSPAEFERLTKISVALGRAMGQDATKSIEDMTIGIGRQSKLILDNLGLMINVEKANAKYAASIGKTADKLTDAEKKQAFLNEALDQGEKKIAGMDTATLDTAGKVERLAARWSDFQIEFGKAAQSMAEGSGLLDLLNDGIDRMIAGAQSWQSVGDNLEIIDLGLKKVNEDTTSWIRDLEQIPLLGRNIKTLDLFGSMIFRSEELKEAMTEAGQEIDAKKKADEEAAVAASKNAGAMEEEGQSAEDLAEHLEKVNDIRRGVARQLLEIEEKAAEDVDQTWEDYFEDEAQSWKDYQKEVAEIQRDSARDQLDIQKDLAKDLANIDKKLTKDLAKVDKDLAKDKSKALKDAAKDNRRSEEDAAREERRQRRQRQIDAKSDERLFQFEMRQLAAEGEFNRILEEKERRAIEQQIGAERQQEEDQAAQEDREIERQRAQEDLQERLQEMEEEAQARKDELQAQAEEERGRAQEQAAEDEIRRQEELAQTLADEQAAYQERLEALRQHREERLAAIEEGKQEAIKKVAEELTEIKELTEREMKDIVPIAKERGDAVGAAFAEGMNRGFERNNKIDEMTGGSGGSSGSGRRIGMGSKRSGSRSFGSLSKFAEGGEFMVSGAGGIDSQLVAFMATPGEKVSVQTPGQQAGGQAVNININAQGPGMREFASIIERKVGEAQEEFFNLIASWSRGE